MFRLQLVIVLIFSICSSLCAQDHLHAPGDVYNVSANFIHKTPPKEKKTNIATPGHHAGLAAHSHKKLWIWIAVAAVITVVTILIIHDHSNTCNNCTCTYHNGQCTPI